MSFYQLSSSPQSDECLTPRYGIEPIVKHLKNKGFKKIWCPFDKEDSLYVRVLKRHGFEVVFSHIEDGEDFFDVVPEKDVDAIVSNPPYSIKDKILKRCYELGLPFALLLPLNALSSLKRVDMYITHGLDLLVFDRRINFYTRGNLDKLSDSVAFATVYYTKGILDKQIVFEKIDQIVEGYNDYGNI
jgi:hypothetical protein